MSIYQKYKHTFEQLLAYDQNENIARTALLTEQLPPINTELLAIDLTNFIAEVRKDEDNITFGNFFQYSPSQQHVGLTQFLESTVFIFSCEEWVDDAIIAVFISIIRNHKFQDGNKRIATFILFWLLIEFNVLNPWICNSLYTTLAIMAASNTLEDEPLKLLIKNSLF